MVTNIRNKEFINFHLSYWYLMVQELFLSWWGMLLWPIVHCLYPKYWLLNIYIYIYIYKFGACQKWEPAGRINDFGNFLNGFAKSPRVLRTVLNIEWVQFVLKNCEILHFVWGLYDKNNASYYCFRCDV